MSPSKSRRQFLHTAALTATASLAGCEQHAALRARIHGNRFGDQVPHWEKRIPALLATHKVPGLSIAVVGDHAILWRAGFGLAGKATGAKVTADTIFEAGSMSKPVFAYRIMKLCEQGILNLDTPLTKYTAERFAPADPRLDLITARHLLSHTSGFQNIRSGAEPLKIGFTPGSRWSYSGEGFAYLQAVMTALTGRTDQSQCENFEAGLKVCATDFDAAMRSRLLEPFSMRSSSYLLRDNLSGNMSSPHDERGEQLPPRKYTAPGVARYGSMGGLLTTAPDYARFLLEVIDPKAADDNRLNAASLAEMLRPQIAVTRGEGFEIWWALGWRFAKTLAGDIISHGGDQPGYHCHGEVSLRRKTGYVLFTNGENGHKLIQELAPEFSRKLYQNS